ncbi:MAG: large conductance mechanosensitive channel protein MscL [Clostridia bacterium]|nr:large conductance mechanosensitive channel protein MscL [Clostridia bacterium]
MEKRIRGIKKFFGEFKTFIMRGNVLDMAVGVIVGGAFTAIVNGLSNFILRPLINWLLALMLGKDGFSGVITMLSASYTETVDPVSGAVLKEVDLANSIYIDWGSFISAVINFLLVAFVLFMIVRTINRVNAAQEKMVDGWDLDDKKEALKIRRKMRVSMKEALAIVEERKAEAKAKAEEEAKLKAEAEAKAKAEEEAKATANTRLLEEIRDLLKNK